MAKQPTYAAIQITGCLGSAVALLVTIYRLVARRRSLWWNDALVFLSLFAVLIFLLGIFVTTAPPRTGARFSGTLGHYLVHQGFYTAIWTSRAAVSLSILKISSGPPRKCLTLGLGVAFLIWVVMFAQVISSCQQVSQEIRADDVVAECSLKNYVAITQIIAGCFFDIFFVGVLVQVLKGRMEGVSGFKMRVFALVSATFAVTVVNLVHASFILRHREYQEFVLAGVGIIFLFVMNLADFITWNFYETSFNDSIPRTNLTGGLALTKGILKMLRRNRRTPTPEMIDYAKSTKRGLKPLSLCSGSSRSPLSTFTPGFSHRSPLPFHATPEMAESSRGLRPLSLSNIPPRSPLNPTLSPRSPQFPPPIHAPPPPQMDKSSRSPKGLSRSASLSSTIRKFPLPPSTTPPRPRTADFPLVPELPAPVRGGDDVDHTSIWHLCLPDVCVELNGEKGGRV
ncbi:hypothetical protein L218DRAFT_904920 [Marasmius fiardii PR-910]|nr:hypothetical protein L218DRAFT_904920 [Marasmius fiardii PR-910]